MDFKKLDKIGGYLFFVGIIGFMIYWSWRSNYYLSNYKKFTIGFVYATSYDGKATKYIDFKYKVSGVEYKSSHSLYNCGKIPGRYYLEYSSVKPSICLLHQSMPVPDSIKEAPANGWDSIPQSPKKKTMTADEFNKMLEGQQVGKKK